MIRGSRDVRDGTDPQPPRFWFFHKNKKGAGRAMGSGRPFEEAFSLRSHPTTEPLVRSRARQGGAEKSTITIPLSDGVGGPVSLSSTTVDSVWGGHGGLDLGGTDETEGGKHCVGRQWWPPTFRQCPLMWAADQMMTVRRYLSADLPTHRQGWRPPRPTGSQLPAAIGSSLGRSRNEILRANEEPPVYVPLPRKNGELGRSYRDGRGDVNRHVHVEHGAPMDIRRLRTLRRHPSRR